jgi:hypothetical protein
VLSKVFLPEPVVQLIVIYSAKFVLTVVTMKITLVWDVIPCNAVEMYCSFVGLLALFSCWKRIPCGDK